MAEEPKTSGELNPIALAGGIPAAEGLAGMAGMLSNISSTLLGIMKNPLISAEGIQQLSRRWDEHVIKRLKEMNNLTKDQAAAFDKLARSGEGVRAVYSRIEGFAIGAGLRIAYLNEQLERQAASIGKYARLQDLSGGSYFNEAKRMQEEYYRNQQKYGKPAADQMRQSEMRLNTAMFTASGITDPTSRSNYARALGLYNQMYGGDAGGFVSTLFSQYGPKKMPLGKGQDILEQLRTSYEGKKFGGDLDFEGVRREFLQLSEGFGNSGMGYDTGGNLSGAVNFMQATRGMGSRGRQNVGRIMSEALSSMTKTSSVIGAGLGISPLELSKQLQKDLESGQTKEAILKVTKGIRNLVNLAGGPNTQRGNALMQTLGLGSVRDLLEVTQTVDKVIEPVDNLNFAFKDLKDTGRTLGPELQKVSEDASHVSDKVGGFLGEKGTQLFGGDILGVPGKTVGYGLSLLSLGVLLRSLGKRGSSGKGAMALLGLGELQKMINSPDVQGAGGGTGGEDAISKIGDIAMTVQAVKSFGTNKAAATVASKAPVIASLARRFMAGNLGAYSLVFENGFSIGLGALAGATGITTLLVAGALAEASYHKNYAKEYTQGVLSARIQDKMEEVSAKTIRDPFTKMWMPQNTQMWLNDLTTDKATSPKTNALDYLTSFGGAHKLNIDPYGNPLPENRVEGGDATGENTTVTIQIVGPGGEDLGKTAVRQGGQANMHLSAGQVLNIAEQR